MAHMQGYKTIKLVNGGETIVDESDFEWVSQFRWFKSSAGYAHRQGWTAPRHKGGEHWCVWLHRDINKTPEHLFTDHVNGNKLDNRRSNLRTCNKAQNVANSGKLKHKRATSKLKGVGFFKPAGLWTSRIKCGAIRKTNYHKTEQEAALDYNRMAIEYFGEFAQLNPIP